VYALNAATGALIWKYQTGSLVESSPAVSNGVVYVGSDDNNVYAIRAKGPNAGTPLWKFATGSEVYQSPVVTNNTVFVGSQDANLYALDAATGSLQWTVATNGIVGSAAVANGVVYATARDGSFYAVDASYGGVLALFETGYSFIGSPTVSDGILYLSTYGSDTYAFSVDSGTGAVSHITPPPKPSSLHPDFALPVTEQ
jgi:outer membrane protein assembly factor BamB